MGCMEHPLSQPHPTPVSQQNLGRVNKKSIQQWPRRLHLWTHTHFVAFCWHPSPAPAVRSLHAKQPLPATAVSPPLGGRNKMVQTKRHCVYPLGHRNRSDLDTSSIWKLRGNGSSHVWGELKDSSSFKAHWARLRKSWNHWAEKALHTPSIFGATVDLHSWRPAEHTELRPAARIHDLSTALPHAIQKQECQIAIALPESLIDLPTQTMPRIWSRKNKDKRPLYLFMQVRTLLNH